MFFDKINIVIHRDRNYVKYNGYLQILLKRKKKNWVISKCISLPFEKKNNFPLKRGRREQASLKRNQRFRDNNKINLAAACIMFTRKPGRKRIMKTGEGRGLGKNGTRDDNGKPNAAIQWTPASDSFIMPAADLISHPELSFLHRSEKS